MSTHTQRRPKGTRKGQSAGKAFAAAGKGRSELFCCGNTMGERRGSSRRCAGVGQGTPNGTPFLSRRAQRRLTGHGGPA